VIEFSGIMPHQGSRLEEGPLSKPGGGTCPGDPPFFSSLPYPQKEEEEEEEEEENERWLLNAVILSSQSTVPRYSTDGRWG